MKNTRAALRYAKAALSTSLDRNKEDVVAQDMQQIVTVFSENAPLRFYLENPVVAESAKRESLQKIFSTLSPLSTQLIELLCTNNRIDLLDQVAEAYLSLLKKHQGKATAVVTTAVAITPALKKIILKKAQDLSTAEINLENIIDPSLLGGFILRIGDLQYNASVAHQLDQLKRELTQTNYSA
ncbi:MAG: ATP synthase F1 subunit delta [Flavobacteriaceae bacterium]